MKKFTVTLLTFFLASIVASAGSWKIDPAHSKIHFTATYLVISEVTGEFKKFDGTISSASENWMDLKADISVEVNSINTDNDMRDKHLKSDDFFNAEKFPAISFKSKAIKNVGKNMYLLNGDLTIRDVTKNVEIPLVYNGQVKDPWGNLKAGFKANGKIDRKEYGLKYQNAAATGEAVVGDEVSFSIDFVLIKQ